MYMVSASEGPAKETEIGQQTGISTKRNLYKIYIYTMTYICHVYECTCMCTYML